MTQVCLEHTQFSNSNKSNKFYNYFAALPRKTKIMETQLILELLLFTLLEYFSSRTLISVPWQSHARLDMLEHWLETVSMALTLDNANGELILVSLFNSCRPEFQVFFRMVSRSTNLILIKVILVGPKSLASS